MKTNILNLIDFPRVNKLLEGFNQSTGFVTAILDIDGNVLSSSGWRQICTRFHRVNAETSEKCKISDTVLADKLNQGDKYHYYKCLNGLVDVAVPIIIKGEHIANLFTGQFFFEKPDPAFFKEQAAKYGFDESEYLSALNDVPVVSKEKVNVAIDFLLNMTQLISDITFQRLEQLQLNEALRKSEMRSLSALDQMLEGCQIIGFDWRYIYLNRTAEVHNRRANDELLGKHYVDMWPGIEETEVYKTIRQTLETRVSDHFEYEFIFPDGSKGWFDLSIQPVPEGVFILSIDITERKKAEIALRDSEEKYKLIADNSNDWIYWIAPEGQMRYVSPACERVTGYTVAEFINNPDLNHDIVIDVDKEKVARHSQIILMDDSPHELEYRILTKTGEMRWITHSCSPIITKNGEYLGRRGTNRNITERKLQEEQLFESEFRFNKLYENGPFGMVISDQYYRIKKANAAFCTLLGYSEEELKELSFEAISHTGDREKDQHNIKKLNNNEIPVYKTEKRYIRKDGREVWGSLTATSTYDSEGKFLYNLGIIEDITHRKQVEEELKKSKKLLSETESVGKVGGWEFNIDTMEQTWTDEVYRIHEVDFDFHHNVNKGINFYADTSKPIIENAVKRVIESGEPFDLELEIITAKGNLRQVHTIGKADIENRRVYGFFQDITERKLQAEQLFESEFRFNKFFENSPFGMVIADVEFRFKKVNPSFCSIIGYSEAELIKFTFEDVSHPDDLSKDMLYIRKLINKEIPVYKTEKRYIRNDGQLIWGSLTVAPTYDSENNILFYLGIIEDITERKRSEETIRELNERISTATRASKIGIWDWDLQTNLLEWDEQMYALYGLKNGEFSGAYQAWVNGLHPDDQEYSQIETRMALDGKKEYDTEFRVLWPDGSIHFLKAKGEVFRNEAGEPLRMVGVDYDITEQREIEQKIREKDQEFRKLSANVPDLLYQFTRKPDGTYFVPIASEGIRNIFGCEPEDVVDDFTPIGRVIYPEDAERVIRDIEYSAAHLSYFTCEFRVQIPGRDIQWILSKSTPEKLPDGSITWYGFNTDITHRKLAEEALRASEAKFRNLIESIPVPVTYLTKSGEISFRNNRFLQVMGYTQQAVPTVSEWWPKAYPDENYRQWVISEWKQAVENARRNNTDIEPIEYNITCFDNIERTMIVSGINLDDNLLITFIDITERKRAEETIKKLNESLEARVEERTAQLKEANLELEAFSYSVSHDLRAPLRHINGFVDLLQEDYADLLPEKGKHYLDVIVNASRDMGKLIDDLLQFSRTGRQEMNLYQMEMNTGLNEVLNFLSKDTENRTIEWTVAKLPEAEADHSLLRMVWQNLIGNAVKFTKDKEPAKIQIGFREDENEYVFFVKDNGAGFDMRYAHKLFGVFQRLHSKQEFEGTGIGLANVRRIINKHGGRTWAESQVNEGATFYFTLTKPKP